MLVMSGCGSSDLTATKRKGPKNPKPEPRPTPAEPIADPTVTRVWFQPCPVFRPQPDQVCIQAATDATNIVDFHPDTRWNDGITLLAETDRAPGLIEYLFEVGYSEVWFGENRYIVADATDYTVWGWSIGIGVR
jgi:hypothetical protein